MYHLRDPGAASDTGIELRLRVVSSTIDDRTVTGGQLATTGKK